MSGPAGWQGSRDSSAAQAAVGRPKNIPKFEEAKSGQTTKESPMFPLPGPGAEYRQIDVPHLRPALLHPSTGGANLRDLGM
jgi:hypothetical protein